jgi:hypothetical protein
MSKPKPDLAFVVRVDDTYGIRRVIATVQVVKPNGELEFLGCRAYEPARELCGLTVRAYLGGNYDTDGQLVWGAEYGYFDVRIDSDNAEYATDIARTMRRLVKGLVVLNDELGYGDGSYAALLARVAKVLGIRTFYVRRSRSEIERIDYPGYYRRATAAGMQSWVADVERMHTDGRFHELVGAA